MSDIDEWKTNISVFKSMIGGGGDVDMWKKSLKGAEKDLRGFKKELASFKDSDIDTVDARPTRRQAAASSKEKEKNAIAEGFRKRRNKMAREEDESKVTKAKSTRKQTVGNYRGFPYFLTTRVPPSSTKAVDFYSSDVKDRTGKVHRLLGWRSLDKLKAKIDEIVKIGT